MSTDDPRLGMFARMAAPDPRAERVGLVLAVSLPSLVYVATLSGHGYFLDSGEFVSVAADLGISHPPGHPVAALTLALARLVPFGPLAARVALICALATAGAVGLHHRLLLRVLSAVGVNRTTVAVPLAVAASATFGLSASAMVGATRPEVYALSTLLAMLCIERAVHLETVTPSSDHRALPALGLAFGLGLGCHHFLAMLVLPVLMPTLARLHERSPRRALPIFGLGTLAGLTSYLLLPLRSLADPMLAFGHPHTPARFAWVVSAAPFHQNVATRGAEPLGDRLADVGMVVSEALSPVGFLVALVGAYVLVRDPRGKRFAVLLLGHFVTSLVARAWLGFVDDNPDALAYLAPAVAHGASLAAIAAGVFITERLTRRTTREPMLALAAVVAALMLSATTVASVESRSLARFTDTDSIADGIRRELPPNAVFFAFDPGTVFQFAGGEAEEHARPDVTLVPMPFLGYPHALDALAEQTPELAPVLRAHALEGHLTLPELQTLAHHRPVVMEMDPRVPIAIRDALAPSGLVYELLPGGTTDGDERGGRVTARHAWRRLARLVDPVSDPETKRFVAFRQLEAAVYYAGFGDLEAARRSLDVARALAPHDQTLLAAERLLAPATARLDLHPTLFPDTRD